MPLLTARSRGDFMPFRLDAKKKAPPVEPTEIKQKIDEAFRRSA